MNAATPQESLATASKSLRRTRRQGWALGIFATLGGLAIALSPALSFGYARTEGTVIKLEPKMEVITHGDPQSREGVWTEPVMVVYPVVEYEVADRKYTYRPRSSFGTYTVGQKEPILYKAERPEVARLDSFTDRWLDPLVLGGPLAFLGVGSMVAMVFLGRMLRTIDATLEEQRRSAEGSQAPGQDASTST